MAALAVMAVLQENDKGIHIGVRLTYEGLRCCIIFFIH